MSRAYSWYLRDLPKLIVREWYRLNILAEYDMQVVVYHLLRRHYDRERSRRWSILTQPALRLSAGRLYRPDIVVLKAGKIMDVFELKMRLGSSNFGWYQKDMEKIRQLKTSHGLRHAYQIYLHDSEVEWSSLPGASPDAWMRQFFTMIDANVAYTGSGPSRRYGKAIEEWKSLRAKMSAPGRP